MADQPPEEIYLKHVRAPDYKEISADGTLHKIVDSHLIITFYIEDSMVTGEVLKREDRRIRPAGLSDCFDRGREAAARPHRGPRAGQGHPRPCGGGRRAHDPAGGRKEPKDWQEVMPGNTSLFSVTNL